MLLPRSLATAALLVCVVQTGSEVSAGAQQATGSISGQVREAGTRNPVGEARVSIVGPGVREAATADSLGRFTFASLAPGVYRLTVDKETFAFDTMRPAGARVEAGMTTAVALEMQRAGVLVGEVRDDRGSPRGGVPVTAIRKVDGGTSTGVGRQRTTNDLGEFRIDGLVAGEYLVLASPPNQRVTTGALMPTYYPATTDQKAAGTVTVRSGETSANVFITMVTAAAYEISGVVVDEQGRRLPRVVVSFVFQAVQTASPTQGTIQAQVQGLMTGADGTFRITGLGPGTYRLTPTPAPPAPNMPTQLEISSAAIKGNASTVRVDVRNANVSGVTIVLRPVDRVPPTADSPRP